MIEKTIVRDLSATLHTERLSWPGMDTNVLLVWFYDSKGNIPHLPVFTWVIENVHDTTILS